MPSELNPEWIGIVAAVACTVSYLPQTLKLFRTHDTSSISLGMYILLAIGLAFWAFYGVLLELPSVIVANGISLLLTVTIIALKLRFH